MALYKIKIENRNYNSWSILNANTLEPQILDNFNPLEHKLFTNDIFKYENNKIEIINSSLKINENIPAVLILSDNKTYGRKNKTKLFYKCIPDDKRMPIFLVPYEIKHVGFVKVFNNLYVTIKFIDWTEKMPHGIITQTIGDINILNNFYEYQLYCKSLNISFQQFNKEANKLIKQKLITNEELTDDICNKYKNIENRMNWKIFTIDPLSSLDYDDGFSIIKKETETLLSIYISNVTILIDYLNLWSSFSQRISTIYLPDHKRPMMPTILSDCLCSLKSNTNRYAFVMDIIIDDENNIKDITYKNCLIKVHKNFVYEEEELINFPEYQLLLNQTKNLLQKYKYIKYINDSHDVVSYLMILMNYNCAQDLFKRKNGIFRTMILKKEIELPDNLPNEVFKFIKSWNNSNSQYINLNTISIDENLQHEFMKMDVYIHITSPIRRIVDLLNIIQIQKNNNLIELTEEAELFYNKWIMQIDYINTTMRSIRKVQNECNLLNLCQNNPEMINKKYDGYCFEKIVKNDGLYQYFVFLPELNISAKISTNENIKVYEKYEYKLFLFNDEEKFKKKIRIQLV